MHKRFPQFLVPAKLIGNGWRNFIGFADVRDLASNGGKLVVNPRLVSRLHR
jgi:hypothetical protein